MLTGIILASTVNTESSGDCIIMGRVMQWGEEHERGRWGGSQE